MARIRFRIREHRNACYGCGSGILIIALMQLASQFSLNLGILLNFIVFVGSNDDTWGASFGQGWKEATSNGKN
jgi:hypothetical protein